MACSPWLIGDLAGANLVATNMTQTRFSPPDSLRHDVENVRGLMLAACMSIAGVKLLLGPTCTVEEAKRFQDEARGRFGAIKGTIARLRARM